MENQREKVWWNFWKQSKYMKEVFMLDKCKDSAPSPLTAGTKSLGTGIKGGIFQQPMGSQPKKLINACS